MFISPVHILLILYLIHTVMIEGFGNEIPEEKFCEAIKYGLTEVRERNNNVLLIIMYC